MKTAAIYVRISKDPVLERLGVQCQENECRELAARLGGRVAHIYEDDDRSAYNGKVTRQGYRALLTDIEDGKLDAVIEWHPIGCTSSRGNSRS
jgi:DNA invertase Pin-like site-specific DNA recombinase